MQHTGFSAGRLAWHLCLLSGLAVTTMSAVAHGSKAGDISIDHPYAVPSPAGSTTGAMYFRALKNNGEQTDRLLGARTAVAASVEIHRAAMDGSVMRMRAVEALPLPAKTTGKPMHGGEWHLMLLNLKAPLKDGDRFTATLHFEGAGEKEVSVWVQQPRSSAAGHER